MIFTIGMHCKKRQPDQHPIHLDRIIVLRLFLYLFHILSNWMMIKASITKLIGNHMRKSSSGIALEPNRRIPWMSNVIPILFSAISSVAGVSELMDTTSISLSTFLESTKAPIPFVGYLKKGFYSSANKTIFSL